MFDGLVPIVEGDIPLNTIANHLRKGPWAEVLAGPSAGGFKRQWSGTRWGPTLYGLMYSGFIVDL